MINNQKLIYPLSMEDKERYINRFISNKNMIELYGDLNQRKQLAIDLFNEKWEKASVTVKKLNGEMFFIE